MKNRIGIGSAVLALGTAPLWMGAKGCEIAVVDHDAPCKVDGRTYQVGETFSDPDGCNTCTCEAGGDAACTLVACVEGCTYEGRTYDVGESFRDDCNTCACSADGTVSCTDAACGDGGAGEAVCEVDGVWYAAGDSFPAADGCNNCTCGEDGSVACTERACGSGSCLYNGSTYAVGERFPDEDGCNSCICEADGEVSCTVAFCEPAEECTFGETSFARGDSVLCPDGCNVCGCSADAAGNLGWASTDAACEPLAALQLCDETDPGLVQIDALYLEGAALAVNLEPSQGCAPFVHELCWTGGFLESLPVQVVLWAKSTGSPGACDAAQREDVVFDVSLLKQAYENAYHRDTGTVVLNVGAEKLRYEF